MPRAKPEATINLLHTYSFYSSAVFRRVTPPTALRKPRQYIHQNVRLDRGRGAMTFGVEIPKFPKVIPKKPGDFSIGNEWEFFENPQKFHLFSPFFRVT